MSSSFWMMQYFICKRIGIEMAVQKNEKRCIRRKAKKFVLQCGDLLYIKKIKQRFANRQLYACIYIQYVHTQLHAYSYIHTMHTHAHISLLQVRYITNPAEKQRILQACHHDPTSGHMGSKRTLAHITERYIWPGIGKDVYAWVSTEQLKLH